MSVQNRRKYDSDFMRPFTVIDGGFVTLFEGRSANGSQFLPLGNLPQTPRFLRHEGSSEISKRLKKMGSPKTPPMTIFRRRLSGYPLASCSSAELASVSPNLFVPVELLRFSQRIISFALCAQYRSRSPGPVFRQGGSPLFWLPDQGVPRPLTGVYPEKANSSVISED